MTVAVSGNTHSIRPFRDGDYDAVCELNNREYPEMMHSPAEWRRHDDNRPAFVRWARVVAEASDGVLLGFADYSQSAGMYHPQRFHIDLLVDRCARHQGVGSALYARLMADLAQYDPLSVRAHVREDSADGVCFALNRGYVETMRFWESVLDVDSFDFAPFADAGQRFQDGGYTIRTADDLAGDAKRDRKLYALWLDLRQDVPHPEPQTHLPFEEFQKRWSNPSTLTDAYFIAVDPSGAYAGSTNLSAMDVGGFLQTGLTGVRREHRRRGVALALKLEAVAYARRRGISRIRTDNESNNRPMLAINERLGFVKEPAWVSLKKDLRHEPAAEDRIAQ